MYGTYKTASKPSTAAEPTEESEAKSICSLTARAQPVTEDMRQGADDTTSRLPCNQHPHPASLQSTPTITVQLLGLGGFCLNVFLSFFSPVINLFFFFIHLFFSIMLALILKIYIQYTLVNT